MNRLICDAIGASRLLRFIYEGYERIVEPHLYGINAANHEALSAWIVEGWSATSGQAGWRNYLVSDMHDIHVLARPFEGPRSGFNPDDPKFRQVYCSVAPASETPLPGAAQ